MLGRYQMLRGKRPPDAPLPAGLRQDTRKHTSHCLRPEPAPVAEFLEDPSERAWSRFAAAYRSLLAERFRNDRSAFDELAALATENDVHLGCSCPTKKNPDVRRCHTYLALEFMRAQYPGLEVVLPP